MTERISLAAPFLSPQENESASAPPASAPAGDANSVELHSPIFASDAGLEQVAAGQTQLASGAKGQDVSRLQRGLIAAGYPLPKFGADGGFGPETRAALTHVQTASGLPATGVLDPQTLAALDAAGGAKATRYPEYDQLFAGGVLHGTIAIGYDEGNSDLDQRAQVIAGLKQRGFTTSDNGASWQHTFSFNGQPVRAELALVDRDTPQAKQQFAQAMSKSSLVIYAGHARYGSGPDFDPITSPAGNFVLGPSYAPGHVTFGANDLAKTPMTSAYQLMFFDGCQTTDYLKDLRSIPRNKNASNLDLVVSDAPINWGDAAQNVFVALDGVLQQRSIDEMQSSYERVNGVGYTADGFADNHFRPG